MENPPCFCIEVPALTRNPGKIGSSLRFAGFGKLGCVPLELRTVACPVVHRTAQLPFTFWSLSHEQVANASWRSPNQFGDARVSAGRSLFSNLSKCMLSVLNPSNYWPMSQTETTAPLSSRRICWQLFAVHDTSAGSTAWGR